MRKYLNIIFCVIALGILAYTFMGEERIYDIFGLEMDVWVYRGIWALIAVSSFFRAKNMTAEEKS